MPEFYNPGAAATGALFDFLKGREIEKRQAMLDQLAVDESRLAGDREGRLREQHAGQMDLQREQLALTRLQRDQQAQTADLDRASKVSAQTPIGPVDEGTAAVLKRGLPGVVDSTLGSTQRQGDPQSVGMTTRETPGVLWHKGTAQRQAQEAFMADPTTTEAQRAFLRAREAAGGENLPAQLFQEPPTQALFRASADRRTVERMGPDGQWVPHQGDIPKDAHWLQEPTGADGGSTGAPYYLPIQTAQGILPFNARTGEFIDEGRRDLKPGAEAGERIARGVSSINQMNNLEEMFNPEWVGPLAGRYATTQLAIAGERGEKGLGEMAAQIASLKNAFIKDITGAQMSEPEALRIMQELPDINNPPDVFLARLRLARQNREFLLRRQIDVALGRVKPEGIPVSEEALMREFGGQEANVPGALPAPAATDAEGWIDAGNGVRIREVP